MRQRTHRRSAESRRFLEEIHRWASKIGVAPERVYVQSMKRKWASCTPTGRVYFSADLLDEPSPFREVVVVHELLHLRIQNHGKLFKSLMNAFVPGWEVRTGGRVNRVCR